MITMNTLANTLPINGKTTGELSAEYPNSFVPAGLTFSIWGVIFLLLLVYVIFISTRIFAKSLFDHDYKYYTLLAINLFLNGTWILAWHYEIPMLSLLIMLGLLYTLIRLQMNLTQFRGSRLGRITIGIYLGWISVATVANTTAVLVSSGWNGGFISEDTWASIMIIIVFGLTVFLLFKKRNWYFVLVAMWALYGIHRNQSHDYFYSPGSLAFVVLLVLSFLLLLKLFSKQRAN